MLGEGGVNLGERAAETTARDVDQVLDTVHVIVLHKVLPILKLHPVRNMYAVKNFIFTRTASVFF